MRKLLNRKYLLYSFIFVFVFLCFFYIKFPNERLKNRVIYEIKTNTGLDADIQHISLAPIVRLNVKSLTLTSSDGHKILIPEAHIKPSLMSLLTGIIDIDYDTKIFKGRAYGSVKISKSNGSLHSLILHLHKIDIDNIADAYAKGLDEDLVIAGLLDGNIRVDESKNGEFDLHVDDLDIENVTLKDMNNIKLPEFMDLRSTLTGQIYKDKTIINELQFDNEEIRLNLKGNTPPLWRLSKGSIDLYYRLEVKGKKFAFLKSFLEKDKRGNVAGKIVGSISNPKLKKATGNNKRSGSFDNQHFMQKSKFKQQEI